MSRVGSRLVMKQVMHKWQQTAWAVLQVYFLSDQSSRYELDWNWMGEKEIMRREWGQMRSISYYRERERRWQCSMSANGLVQQGQFTFHSLSVEGELSSYSGAEISSANGKIFSSWCRFDASCCHLLSVCWSHEYGRASIFICCRSENDSHYTITSLSRSVSSATNIELIAIRLGPYYPLREFTGVITITVHIPPAGNTAVACDPLPEVSKLQTWGLSLSPGISIKSFSVLHAPPLSTSHRTPDPLCANATDADSSTALPPQGRLDHNLVLLTLTYRSVVQQPGNIRTVRKGIWNSRKTGQGKYGWGLRPLYAQF